LRETLFLLLVMGLMSGTSADGIDAALVHISDRPPQLRTRLQGFACFPYPPRVRREILRLASGEPAPVAAVARLNVLLGELFAHAARQACRRFRISPRLVDLIGSHGQTIYHQGRPSAHLGRPRICATLQIAEPAVIAARTGIPTVGDFRPADLAAGGQGAPLVPFVDCLLYRDPHRGRVALNIGGIANLTAIPPGGADTPVRAPGSLAGRHLINAYRGSELQLRRSRPQKIGALAPAAGVFAFDTGPGNMLIDALAAHLSSGRLRYDRDARMARRGRLEPALLAALLADPYFRRPPPKSAGREQFGPAFLARALAWAKRAALRPEDFMHTATLLTPVTILDALHRWVQPHMRVDDLIVSGGGAHNPLILSHLRAGLPGMKFFSSGEWGVPEDAKEAFAFAVLAYESYHRRPANLPSATGASRPAVLGKLCFP
jgi:anhydro-N-acetylmuramic acid kinase